MFFGKDEYSEMLQVADLIVTSLNSAYWKFTQDKTFKYIDDLPEYNQFLKIYWPLFVKNSDGKVERYGIKVWW